MAQAVKANQFVLKPAPPPAPTVIDPQAELLRKRQETLGAYLELQRQKEALLQKYMGQQKTLLESMTHPELDEATRSKLHSELIIIEDAIKAIKPPQAEESALEHPQKQPILRGGPAIRSRGRGRGSFTLQPAGPHAHAPQSSLGTFKLDLRPKTIKMSPIPAKLGTDQGSIRKFFEPYGQVTNLVVDESVSTATVTFVKRSDAEKAMFYLSKSEEGTSFAWEVNTTSTGMDTAERNQSAT
jgi:hypothetical protein